MPDCTMIVKDRVCVAEISFDMIDLDFVTVAVKVMKIDYEILAEVIKMIVV